MMRSRTALVALAFLAVGALSADAQVRQNQFQIVVDAGYQSYASGSALDAGASLGAQANYYITPSIGIGLWTDLTFTETDGSKFPPAALSFVDSTTFNVVGQPADIWQYGAQVRLQLPRSLAPFLLAGAGAYTVFLDPQQNSANTNFTDFAVKFAAGVDWAVSEVAGFELGVSDSWYPNWDPARLFPVSEDNQNTRFPELNPNPDDLSTSVHNFKVYLGVVLVPGAG